MLRWVCRDHQFAQLRMGNTARRAQFVQQRFSAHAQRRDVRPGRVIKPGVNHLTIARTHALTDVAFALNHDGLAPRLRQRTPDRQTHGTGTDH